MSIIKFPGMVRDDTERNVRYKDGKQYRTYRAIVDDLSARDRKRTLAWLERRHGYDPFDRLQRLLRDSLSHPDKPDKWGMIPIGHYLREDGGVA
jgi:hypothetical protein